MLENIAVIGKTETDTRKEESEEENEKSEQIEKDTLENVVGMGKKGGKEEERKMKNENKRMKIK